MATYLRNEIAYYSEVSMKLDFNKFTDRQIYNIIKQIKNGALSYGQSATSTVANWLLQKYPMPHFKYDSYYIRWNNLPFGHPFFPKIKQLASMAKLQSDLSDWERRQIEDAIKSAEDNKPSAEFRIYHYDKHEVKDLKKLMVIENEMPDELKIFLDKMERRELGAVNVDFYDFADSH